MLIPAHEPACGAPGQTVPVEKISRVAGPGQGLRSVRTAIALACPLGDASTGSVLDAAKWPALESKQKCA
jgi:hypothetical protein